MSKNTISRIVGALAAIALTISIFTIDLQRNLSDEVRDPWFWIILAISTIVVFTITPYITVIHYIWLRDKIRVAAASDLIAAAIGLTVGLIISALLAFPLEKLPGYIGNLTPFLAAVVCGYIGLTSAVLRKNDIAHLFQTAFIRRTRERDREDERERDREHSKKTEHEKDPAASAFNFPLPLLLDTSTIIDGRIADISQTGFINGTIVIPRFVLNELQRIADSSDTMRRNRGRRGLDILNQLQKDANVPIEIIDIEVEGIADVDSKLVKLARDHRCPIITNDFNLNRVAELQGIKVLNINELANAIKPVLLPGEDIHIKIMQDGKELGQGVGYLDDGTMIVVENGRQYMNATIEVTVTRVLQTVAGRMIFAHPKQYSPLVSPPTPTKQRQM
jgi:uncharacterized protein YacL